VEFRQLLPRALPLPASQYLVLGGLEFLEMVAAGRMSTIQWIFFSELHFRLSERRQDFSLPGREHPSTDAGI